LIFEDTSDDDAIDADTEDEADADADADDDDDADDDAEIGVLTPIFLLAALFLACIFISYIKSEKPKSISASSLDSSINGADCEEEGDACATGG
jgi:hypothetical protein